MDHSPWDDITFADFVMPFFLFMVGVSMSISFRKYREGLVAKVGRVGGGGMSWQREGGGGMC